MRDRHDRAQGPRAARAWLTHTLPALALALLWASGASAAAAQDRPAQRGKMPDFDRLHTAPGKVLSRGHNQTPVGALRAKAYRLEEVPLDEPFEAVVRGASKRVDKAHRLTVTLDSTVNGPYLIWVGEDAFYAAHTAPGEVSSVILGAAVAFDEGAVVAVSRGANVCDAEALSTLPERLSVPPGLRRARPAEGGEANAVRALRSLPAAERGSPDVELELSTDLQWPPRNQTMVLQIGAREFERDADVRGTTLAFRLTAEEFAAVKDGEPVRVKYGRCTLGGVRFGRLDKGLLDR